MSAVMFPMFLPEDFFIDKLVRAIIAISLFESAYVADVIRGGLQALPRGQYEAAKSLGMARGHGTPCIGGWHQKLRTRLSDHQTIFSTRTITNRGHCLEKTIPKN